MPVPYSKLRALNKSEEEPWKRLPSSISPNQDIVGGFEVFHQLYCLVSMEITTIIS